jgi:hypothetical protein
MTPTVLVLFEDAFKSFDRLSLFFDGTRRNNDYKDEGSVWI